MDFNGSNYLVLSDYYSRWIEIDKMSSTTSAAIIDKLSVHFSREGIPRRMRTDNDPRFMSEVIKSFWKKMDIQHSTSSPIYPKANGHAEKAVDIAKRILKKSADAKTNLHTALLEYRNMPVDGFRSPAQLLKGRQLRSILPCTTKHLEPKTVSPAEWRKARLRQQQRQSYYYNKNAAPLPPLSPGQPVWCQLEEDGQWRKAVVKSIHDSRSYWIQAEAGGEYRRNRVHLRPRVPGSSTTVPPHEDGTQPNEPPVPTPTEPTDPPQRANNQVAPRTSGRLRKPRTKVDV